MKQNLNNLGLRCSKKRLLFVKQFCSEMFNFVWVLVLDINLCSPNKTNRPLKIDEQFIMFSHEDVLCLLPLIR